MSRRHAAEKREVLPDAKYGDTVLTKFMNNLMIDGKKSVAERIVYSALERVESKLKRSPIEVFTEALDNVKVRACDRSIDVADALPHTFLPSSHHSRPQPPGKGATMQHARGRTCDHWTA